ncbi:hypothetical protein HHI36_019114 [Cryptolaemus montrouzieri]|uniref:Uncharacterized protein n=1 Tax=Cryptolaemus montrouzieri TaxID=559131 RepID=A0ABD2P2H8_9CUCU
MSAKLYITWLTNMNTWYSAGELQGRLAYALMSIYAPCPKKFQQYIQYDLEPVLYGNMICGICIMIFGRKAMALIRIFYRVVFAVGGTFMFCEASLVYFRWIRDSFPDKSIEPICLGYFGGRVFMVHLLAYLYHVDTRTLMPGYLRPKYDMRYEYMYHTY